MLEQQGRIDRKRTEEDYTEKNEFGDSIQKSTIHSDGQTCEQECESNKKRECTLPPHRKKETECVQENAREHSSICAPWFSVLLFARGAVEQKSVPIVPTADVQCCPAVITRTSNPVGILGIAVRWGYGIDIDPLGLSCIGRSSLSFISDANARLAKCVGGLA